MLAKKGFTRDLLKTPQNLYDMNSEALKAQLTEKNAERKVTQEQVLNQILQAK